LHLREQEKDEIRFNLEFIDMIEENIKNNKKYEIFDINSYHFRFNSLIILLKKIRDTL
jgi:hypothetical protein